MIIITIKIALNINYFFLSLFLSLLAFLSYEISIIILPLIILFDVFITKIKLRQDKVVFSYLPFAVLTFVYPFVRSFSNSVSFGGDYSYNLSNLIQNFYFLPIKDWLNDQDFFLELKIFP